MISVAFDLDEEMIVTSFEERRPVSVILADSFRQYQNRKRSGEAEPVNAERHESAEPSDKRKGRAHHCPTISKTPPAGKAL